MPLVLSSLVECWLRVREVTGSIPDKGTRYQWYQGFPRLALNIRRETLALSQIAIIPSLRTLWKNDLNIKKTRFNKVDPQQTHTHNNNNTTKQTQAGDFQLV